ncbi:MAG: winged helix-turn-helix domain-containing protein [Bryobacteraceae bacterium]
MQIGLHNVGPFVVDPVRRTFLRENAILPLTPKELDILRCLVGREVVSKETLIARAWPDVTVSGFYDRVQAPSAIGAASLGAAHC